MCKSHFFGGGAGGIFAVFLFNIHPARPEVDSWTWIVVGDIPSAYLPLEDANSAAEVFETRMSGWANGLNLLAKGEAGLPMTMSRRSNVPPTPEMAEKLEQRLHSSRFIGEPFFDDTDQIPHIN
jgi:hypothetical protein